MKVKIKNPANEQRFDSMLAADAKEIHIELGGNRAFILSATNRSLVLHAATAEAVSIKPLACNAIAIREVREAS